MQTMERKGVVRLCTETPLSDDTLVTVEPTNNARKVYVRVRIGEGIARHRTGKVRVKRYPRRSS